MGLIISDCVLQGSPKLPFCNFKDIWFGELPVKLLEAT